MYSSEMSSSSSAANELQTGSPVGRCLVSFSTRSGKKIAGMPSAQSWMMPTHMARLNHLV